MHSNNFKFLVSATSKIIDLVAFIFGNSFLQSAGIGKLNGMLYGRVEIAMYK